MLTWLEGKERVRTMAMVESCGYVFKKATISEFETQPTPPTRDPDTSDLELEAA